MAKQGVNLVLSFKLAGDRDCRVCGAARITVDGRGGLTLHHARNGRTERIDLAELQSLSIRSLVCAGRAA